MPIAQTRHFGALPYEEAEVLDFAAGLPGFEDQKRFLAVAQAGLRPVVFLQSLSAPGLCFLTLPAAAIAADLELDLPEAELTAAGLRPPGCDWLRLAIVTIHENAPATANLLAPVVVDVRSRRAAQVVCGGSGACLHFPLEARRD